MKNTSIIRAYTGADKQACVDLFNSNCPKYFEYEELPLFEAWLSFRGDPKNEGVYFKNAAYDAYYMIEHNTQPIACGGFYVLKEKPEARMAWGMVHNAWHRKGFGTLLYNYRVEQIYKLNPGLHVALDTSQHTYGFYEKMGLKVDDITKNGYGANLDKYDMA